MLGQLERFLKQAIIDRQAVIASAALVAAIKMFRFSPEIIRRWINEVCDSSFLSCFGREREEKEEAVL